MIALAGLLTSKRLRGRAGFHVKWIDSVFCSVLAGFHVVASLGPCDMGTKTPIGARCLLYRTQA